MDSGFTLTIDWLAFTVLASNPHETMRVLGSDWNRAKGGFRGYPLSWMRADGLREVGKLGTINRELSTLKKAFNLALREWE
jgi:phage replication initiation protein